MAYLTLPEKNPIIYHDTLGNKWKNEEEWMYLFNMKFQNITWKKKIREYQDSEKKYFVIFFTTRFLEGDYKDIPHLMMAVGFTKEGLGKYIEITKIYRFGFYGEIDSLHEVDPIIKEMDEMKILIKYSVPATYIGNVTDYQDLLKKIYNKMKDVRL